MIDAAIGISVGSKNTVIGTYDKVAFKVILSDTSSRTIPTVISFSGKERNFGDIAFNKNRQNFKSTIIYPNRWLGIKYDNALKDEESKFANLPPVKNINDVNNNSLGFNIDIKGQKTFHTPEIIMGSFFNKIKNIWVNQNIYTHNIVISIPDYCTIYEREAMLNAVYISGLNCLGLLNESSAISINYAYRELETLNANIPRLVCFIDLGHSHLTICYTEFTTKTIKVLSVSSERFCGARDLDFLIAEKISYEFQKQNGIDLFDSPKAKISLMNNINKIRKNLTVNQEGTISIDEIVKGRDLVHNLTKKDMEEIIKPILTKFENLCNTSLKKLEKLGYSINNIYSVEMVGDTLRTPCFSEIIKKVYKKELSKTLVPDECIAKGCTLFAMMHLPNYRIQNFFIKHYNPYEIFLENPNMKIFEEGINFPTTKKFKLNNQNQANEFRLKFIYNNTQELNCFNNKLIQEYKINIPYNNYNNAEFEYELDMNCIPKLKKVTLQNENIKFDLIKQNFGLSHDVLELYRNEESARDENDLIMKEVIGYKNSLEEYIYKIREKLNSVNLNGKFTKKEKDTLNEEMDKVMNWLYSDDEDLYNINKLEEKSKNLKSLGDSFYMKINDWNEIKLYLGNMETLLYEKLTYFASLEDEIKKGKRNDITLDKINKINEYIQKEFNNYEQKAYEIDVADKTKPPKFDVQDIQNMIISFNNNIEQMKK